MGAERWLGFKSVKEAARVKEFLAPLNGAIETPENYCGLRWTRPCKLEVSYSFGGLNDGEFATFICREIARRFSVVRIGADSVGWYTDDNWSSLDARGAPARYGTYSKWAEWLKDYRAEWAHDVRFEPSAIAEVRRIEAAAVEVFKGLDKEPE